MLQTLGNFWRTLGIVDTRERAASSESQVESGSFPYCRCLAVVSVSQDFEILPRAKHMIEPFKDVRTGFAQMCLNLNVRELPRAAVEPQ